MKMLLSVTHPPSSEALRADTATPSGSGVQASEHKSTQYFSSLSDSYKSSSWFLVKQTSHDQTNCLKCLIYVVGAHVHFVFWLFLGTE